jgi:CRISPR-associated endonuclease Csn1
MRTKNPYYYRHLCLHEKLDMDVVDDRYILGRAFYHLAQRRGFLSNRLDNSEDENENGVVKAGITELTKEMEINGCEYLADFFYKIYSDENNHERIRTRYTDREEHYEKEFQAICKKQDLNNEFINELTKALYFQRPLKSQRQGVGKCTFEPRKPRCADSHPDYEEFRMLSFFNNIKIQGPYDLELRNMSSEERDKIHHCFFRVSKINFTFEDIAKALAGKNNYQYYKDKGDKAYKFNYRMTQGVTGCPVTAQLIKIFGEDWKNAIAESYLRIETKKGQKTIDNIVNDVWNVLYSFSSKDKLKDWAIRNLQLDGKAAEAFSKIKLSHSFAALSLKAIRKILPFLRNGMIYSHAVEIANIPSIVGDQVWNNEEKRSFIIENVKVFLEDKDQPTKDFCIKGFLQDNFDLKPGVTDKLYHPSMIDVYPDAKQVNGVYQLGSPRTNAIRNPMAMRSLHEIRKVINQLLKEKIIDINTEVHIEYARELNDANKRKAIADYQLSLDKKHKEYADEIVKLFKEETGQIIIPTKDDILKFQLWNEQSHLCLYTGKQIGIADFIGKNPKFDIEHTIPRSVGGDFTVENLTLCDSKFNRDIKGAQLPSQLSNYQDILPRIEKWKELYVSLTKQIDKCTTFSGMIKDAKDRIIQKRHRLQMERNYWRGKYERFTMTEVPEGFSLRQGASIGLVSKYAGLYLKSLFHDSNDRHKSNVYTVKGTTTAEFRKMWGLQNYYEKKSRDNHCHHCIDAITIACIGKYEYSKMAEYYHNEELFDEGKGIKPQFKKPWPSFTQDILNLEQSLIVVHSTPDNMPKKAKKYIKTKRGKILAKGDCARGSMHNDTYYGAIERDGEILFVVRKKINSNTFKESDIDNIVDEEVKSKVKAAFSGKNFNEIKANPIYMNKEKGIYIKKVRCYVSKTLKPFPVRSHRDISQKKYKSSYYVSNESNYMMAIYEQEVNHKQKREFELVKNIEAANFFKKSTDREDYPSLVPNTSKSGYPLKYKLKVGLFVILYENSPQEVDFTNRNDLIKRMYYITRLNFSTGYGVITMKHDQEAKQSKDCPGKKGLYKENEIYRPVIVYRHNQLQALVEGYDFKINILGEIEPINK